jgi:hypothetical protein
MSKPVLPRLAAACGIVFPIALFIANGNGSGDYSPFRVVAGTWALVLFLPFISYLANVLRSAEGTDGWLSSCVFAAGLCGITLKIGSDAPALALHHAALAHGTLLYKALDEMSAGATVISLYPLAICSAAVAIVGFRTGILPRWLSGGAGFTAVGLAVNGGFLYAGFVPALLLFLLWTLVTGIVLFRRTGAAHSARTRARTAAA